MSIPESDLPFNSYLYSTSLSFRGTSQILLTFKGIQLELILNN